MVDEERPERPVPVHSVGPQLAEVTSADSDGREPIHPAVQYAREMRRAAGVSPSLVSAEVLVRVLAVFKQRGPRNERVRSERHDDAA